MPAEKDNEATFDQVEQEYKALVEGEELATAHTAEKAGEAEYGSSISDNERQQAAIDSFDDEGESLRQEADEAIDAVKSTGTYTDTEIEDVTDKVNEWKEHLNGHWGRARVKGWLEDLD